MPWELRMLRPLNKFNIMITYKRYSKIVPRQRQPNQHAKTLCIMITLYLDNHMDLVMNKGLTYAMSMYLLACMVDYG